MRLMENDRGLIGPVNLGNPHESTIRELAEKILLLIPESQSTLVFKPLPSDDPMQRRPEIHLAKETLDWTPKTTLDEGLEKTISYFRRKLKSS